jgi:benzoate-CoA ligase
MLRRGKLKDHAPKYSFASGDAVSSQLCAQWKEATGHTLFTLFGTSQCGAVFANLGNYPIDSLGEIVPGVEIKIVDDNGDPVPEGVPGEMWVRGRSNPLMDVVVSGVSSIEDGWVTTRDMLLAKNGTYYFAGRKNDVFKVNGFFVRTYTVEEHARTVDGVEDAIAVPDIDTTGISRVKVYVVTEDGVTDHDRISREVLEMHNDLESHERPRLVEFIDEIPKHPTSMKTQRFRLNPYFTKSTSTV